MRAKAIRACFAGDFYAAGVGSSIHIVKEVLASKRGHIAFGSVNQSAYFLEVE